MVPSFPHCSPILGVPKFNHILFQIFALLELRVIQVSKCSQLASAVKDAGFVYFQ